MAFAEIPPSPISLSQKRRKYPPENARHRASQRSHPSVTTTGVSENARQSTRAATYIGSARNVLPALLSVGKRIPKHTRYIGSARNILRASSSTATLLSLRRNHRRIRKRASKHPRGDVYRQCRKHSYPSVTATGESENARQSARAATYIGSARNIPHTPPSADPAETASSTVAGLAPAAELITRGEMP